jgi:hypothetical protein
LKLAGNITNRLEVLFFFAMFVMASPVFAAAPEWQVFKGKHFLVHYLDNPAFAEKVAGRAEEYYGSITVDLGFARFDNFWLWENRVKIYIYSSKGEFARATNAPEWAIGKTECGRREIFTFPGNDDFMDSVLPHEMTHLILMDFIGFKGEIPLWLNEGVAQWEEPAKRAKLSKIARRLAAGGQYISLDKLMRMDVKQVVASGQAGNFYAQSMSMVGFMIKKHGSERFRTFCGQIRDGKKLDDSLRFAYPESIRNIGDLEIAWKKYVTEEQEADK